MKKNTMMLGALALLATGVAGFAAGKTTTQPGPVAHPEHKWLATHAGEFTAKMSGMMGESDGTSKTKSTLGGLWNVTHFESTIMDMPFKGLEILGYDPEKKKFVSVWVDSMTPKLMTMEGTYDAASKTLTMRGQSTGMDGQKAEMVNTTEFRDGGMVFKMTMEGDPAPMMTIEYAPKK